MGNHSWQPKVSTTGQMVAYHCLNHFNAGGENYFDRTKRDQRRLIFDEFFKPENNRIVIAHCGDVFRCVTGETITNVGRLIEVGEPWRKGDI